MVKLVNIKLKKKITKDNFNRLEYSLLEQNVKGGSNPHLTC